MAAMATAQTCLGGRFAGVGSQATALQSLKVPARVISTRFAKGRQIFQAPQAAASVSAPSTSGASKSVSVKDDAEMRYLKKRAEHVTAHFGAAMGVDDFMQRLEVALWNQGFKNGNVIAMVNLCRDEVTHTLKHKIDQLYGSSFSTHGLGGVLTCGVTGVGAGLSHSPVDETTGKERYVFFSFPHIGIDSKGVVGNISRPGRAAMSCACGAVIKALGEFKQEGIDCNCLEPGVHMPLDVEYSILKQRLARRLKAEGQTDATASSLDLVQLTKVAERTISSDLEFLISKAVDPSKADYAVVTGVQIHNWATEFDGPEPNLEWVAPTNVYTVVNGVRTDVDITKLPGLTPRQIRLLASAPDAHAATSNKDALVNSPGLTTVREIDPPYMYSTKEARKKLSKRAESFAKLAAAAPAPPKAPTPAPAAAAPSAAAAPAAAPAAPAPAPAVPAAAAAPAAPAAEKASPAAPAVEKAAPAAPAAAPVSASVVASKGKEVEQETDKFWQAQESGLVQGWKKFLGIE